MQVNFLSFKYKIFLFLSILPLSYLIYHIVGFENGLNAYVQKIKTLKNKEARKEYLTDEIKYFKAKLKLLDKDNIDLDYLEEKSIELGKAPNNSFTIKIK
jgi:cell division protein FtsB